MNYDLIVIGSGPGGYVAAIRGAQLGLKTAIVESAELGGVCLNWGCIPTKALLKSAQVFQYLLHAETYGVCFDKFSSRDTIKPDLEKMVARSRNVAETMNKGVAFLLQKNKVDVIRGFGKVKPNKIVEVKSLESGETNEYSANHIIIATGARSRELPNLPQDGKKIIDYRKAMTMLKQPESMVVVGSGAIGSEFAYFYQSIGTKVTLIEFLSQIVPAEDADVSAQLSRSFRKNSMKIMVDSSIEHVDTTGDLCKCTIKTKKGEEIIEAEIVLSAVGITTNIEHIGLEDVGIEIDETKIKVDEFYRTNQDGYYAIGDVVHGPALAHVASHEALVCVEKIAGLNPHPVNYNNVPGCTYTTPEIASVGLSEKKAQEAGYEIKVGKFPFTASGKATAAGNRDGFVKVIFDAKTDEMLGCHMIGDTVTEMISEAVIIREKNIKAHEILSAIHPHPTMSEALMEAVAAAYGQAVHL
ncbi:MAG: dihydrolipoyl dehydrogenase [Bacteroidales bacterium]|nr:dihydrolipoyl dehydrogenase [Bacteroidales bacterium]